MLPILEKKGLIIKTIDKPVLISAVPPEKALNHLLETEKIKISKRVIELELNLKEINLEVSNFPHREKITEDQFLFQLTTDEQIKNRADLTFENAKTSYDLHINMDLLNAVSKILTIRFLQLNKNVHVRIIIENTDKNEVHKIIQTLRIKDRQFELKLKKPSDTISYYVVDGNEIWISLKKKTESGHPAVLWTNDKNMVRFFQENFENNWNNPKLKKFH
jgi:sugar-specific transcriptional regulator TrmB